MGDLDKTQGKTTNLHFKLKNAALQSAYMEMLYNIYFIKKQLLSSLPEMANKVYFKTLRLIILNTSIDVNNQLMRIDMIVSILENKYKMYKPRKEEGVLNFDSYLRSGLDGVKSIKTDIALLTHLIMIENVEISSFALLKKMSKVLQNKTVSDLIQQNLTDAMNSKINLNKVLDQYLI